MTDETGKKWRKVKVSNKFVTRFFFISPGWMSSNGFENLAAKISLQPSFITCGLYYNSIYDRKNYDASYDRTSGVGIYDAKVL